MRLWVGLAVLLSAACGEGVGDEDVCVPSGSWCSEDTKNDIWHTSCGTKTHCKLCGFCPTCRTSTDCFLCKDGYHLHVLNTTSCTGRCVPLSVETKPAACRPHCSCDKQYKIPEGRGPRKAALQQLGELACTPEHYEPVPDTSHGLCQAGTVGIPCSHIYTDALCTSGLHGVGCYRCHDFSLQCFSSEFIEVFDEFEYCDDTNVGDRCNTSDAGAMCDHHVDDYVYGCYKCPPQPTIAPLECSNFEYIQHLDGTACELYHTHGSSCSIDSTHALCTNNAYGYWGCWRCSVVEAPPASPAGIPAGGVLLGEPCTVGTETCNACGGRYQTCEEEEECAPYGDYCKDYDGVGSGAIFVNSSVVTSDDYVVTVSKQGSGVVFAVRFGGEPVWFNNEEAGADTWQCGSAMGNSVLSFERCELFGCGAFQISVVAEHNVAWTVRVCQPEPVNELSGVWCGCEPEGACVWGAHASLSCVCPASAEAGYLMPESLCKDCTPGFFPQAQDSPDRCKLTCKNFGTLNYETDSCDCVGAYQGAQCEECSGGLVGVYCNRTAEAMSYSIYTSFTLSKSTFTPPLWKVYPNSEVKVTVKSPPDVSLQSVLSDFKLTAVASHPATEPKPKEFKGRASFEVEAAYYGPKPGLSSFTSQKFLHLFVEDMVYVYSYDNVTGFKKDTAAKVEIYYRSIDIERCEAYLGSSYSGGFDAVFFWQDPAVRKPGYDSSDACGSYETRDYLVFVKGGKTCWVTGDADLGRPWSVSGIGQYTGWDRIEGLFMNTPDGSYWQNYEGIEFMEVFNDEGLAEDFSKPNILRAAYVVTNECLDQTGKSSEWLRANCLHTGDEYIDSWDAIFATEDHVVLLKNQTVRYMNITSMRCCNGSQYDAQPDAFCSSQCEPGHNTGMRLFGNALQPHVTPYSYPTSCHALDFYSQCTEATYAVNTYMQNATLQDFLDSSVPFRRRVTAIAYGKLVTGVSTEASLPQDGPADPSTLTTEDLLDDVDPDSLPVTDPRIPEGDPADIPGGVIDTIGEALESPESARAASCTYEYAEDNMPLLVFEEHTVRIVIGEEASVQNIAVAFPGLDRGFPYALSWESEKPGVQHITGADHTLSFKLRMHDESDFVVFINEYVVPVLLECGDVLTDGAETCFSTLEPWVDNSTTFQSSIRGPDVCRANTTARLTGWDAQGVLSSEGVFHLKDMGITKAGLYKIQFVHPPTGLSITSSHIFVSEAKCSESSEEGDTCTVDCLTSLTSTDTAECTVALDPNKEYVALTLGIDAFLDVEVVVDVVQPCCNSRGLCCAGFADCTQHTTGERLPIPAEHCTCFNSIEGGIYDSRHDCAKCIPGYDLIEGCKASTFLNDKATTYQTAGDVKLGPGKRHFFVIETQPETHLTTSVTNLGFGLGDADLSVTFAACPGQEAMATGTPAPGELSPVCTGHGTCSFNDTLGSAQCTCDEGYWGGACEEVCCSGHGYCDQDTGDNCQCTGTWSAVPRTVTTTVADLSTFITEEEKATSTYDSPHHTEATLNGTAGESFRAYIRWSGMDVPGRDAVTYAAIELTQSEPTPCDGSARLLVYATQPATMDLPAETQESFCSSFGDESECVGMGCCVWGGADGCLGAVPSGPVSDEQGCALTCDVVLVHSQEPSSGCGPNAAFVNDSSSEHFGQCKCDTGFSCSWGKCLNTSLVCNVATSDCAALEMTPSNGVCICLSGQNQDLDGDAASIKHCEASQCVTPVFALNYTWSATDLETTNLTDILDLKSSIDYKAARFYGLVASVDVGTPENSSVTTIVITKWLQSITQHLNTEVYNQMDLSFAFVIEPHETNTCVPSFHSAAAVNESVRPKLMIQSKGNHQPSRLFLGLEESGLSELQAGHPFYGMWTADSLAGVKEIGSPSSTLVRKIRRYKSDLLSTRNSRSLTCLDAAPPYPASSACMCGLTEENLANSLQNVELEFERAGERGVIHQQVVDGLEAVITALELQMRQQQSSQCDSQAALQLLEEYVKTNETALEEAGKQLQQSVDEISTWGTLRNQASQTFMMKMEDSDARLGYCPCSSSAVFQDPIDYTQIGEWMYFLAHTDWEVSADASPSCSGTDGLFQGPRELFFTKGTPPHTPGEPGGTGFQDGIEETDTYSTQSQTETRMGTSEFPQMTGMSHGKWGASTKVRASVFNMKVFTRTKELTKMRNPGCASGSCGEIAEEVLVFVGSKGGGDNPSTLDQEPQESQQLPGLWMSEVISSTGKPKAPIRLLDEVSFPSYVTVVTVTDSNGETFDNVVTLGTQGDSDDFVMSPAEEGYDQQTGSFGSPPLKHPHRYAIPTQLNIYLGTKSQYTSFLAEGPNVGPCTHPQGHPGFTMFQNKMYFYFEESYGHTQLQQIEWTSPEDTTKSDIHLGYLNEAGEVVDLIPSIPPLDKGYFKPLVVKYNGGDFLLLSLGEPADDIDDVCLRAAGCDDSDPSAAPPLHQYQKSFKCLDKGRGITDLWWWDGDTTVAELGVHLGRVHVPTNFTGYPQDPTWTLSVGGTSFYWVRHTTGLSNRGFHESRTEFEHTRDQQVLMFTEYKQSSGEWETETVWEPGDAVHIYDLTLWRATVVFWAFSDLTDDDCYPPGKQVVYQGKVITAGVNVPSYSGCKRSLMATSPDGVKEEYVGTASDGVGVPRGVQCCDDAVAGAPDFDPTNAKHISLQQVDAIPGCKKCTLQRKFWGWDHDRFCCEGIGPVDSPGCNASCVDPPYSMNPMMRNMEDFIYPRYNDPQHTAYSETEQWSKPATGWWFTGFHSMWTDARASRAGVPVWNLGKGLLEMGTKGDEQRLASGSFPGLVGYELYRPGGFAWREHWPRTIGLWEEQTDELKNDCEGCAPGFYGPTCASACPSYKGLVCNGYTCNEGIYGDGTCDCNGEKGGVKCETSVFNEVFSFAAASDTVVEDFAECEATETVACYDVGNTSYMGSPDVGLCGTSIGCNTEDGHCCGASIAPIALRSESVMVVAWTDITVTTGMDVVDAVVVLDQYAESVQSCAPSDVFVYALPKWDNYPNVGLYGVETLAEAYPLGSPVGGGRQEAPQLGLQTEIDITSWVESQVSSSSWSGELAVAIVAGECDRSDCCIPYFKSREFVKDWGSSCHSPSIGCTSTVPTISSSAPHLRVTVEPEKAKCTTFGADRCTSLGYHLVADTDIYCFKFTCSEQDCCELEAESEVTLAGVTAAQATTSEFRDSYATGLAAILEVGSSSVVVMRVVQFDAQQGTTIELYSVTKRQAAPLESTGAGLVIIVTAKVYFPALVTTDEAATEKLTEVLEEVQGGNTAFADAGIDAQVQGSQGHVDRVVPEPPQPPGPPPGLPPDGPQPPMPTQPQMPTPMPTQPRMPTPMPTMDTGDGQGGQGTPTDADMEPVSAPMEETPEDEPQPTPSPSPVPTPASTPSELPSGLPSMPPTGLPPGPLPSGMPPGLPPGPLPSGLPPGPPMPPSGGPSTPPSGAMPPSGGPPMPPSGSPPIPNRRGRELLAATTHRFPLVQLQAEAELSHLSTPIENALFGQSACVDDRIDTPAMGMKSVCSLVVPRTAGFAVVRVLAFDSAIDYTMEVRHVPWGNFDSSLEQGVCDSNTVDGFWTGVYCRECQYRWSGEGCTEYSPAICDDTTCPPENGRCVSDPSTGNLKKKCECHPMSGSQSRHGINCEIVCDPSTDCSGHGHCAEDGKCACEANWQKNNDCSECTEGQWGADCSLTCTCNVPVGTCDVKTGMCIASLGCSGGASLFTGVNCDECAENYYPTGLCNKVCLASQSCSGNGVCNADGACTCNSAFYGPRCQSECSDAVTCNAKGTCASLTESPYVVCKCEGNWGTGYVGDWDMARQVPLALNPVSAEQACSACSDSYYGEATDCVSECRCNLVGRCNSSGECICFQDPAVGYYAGPSCRSCEQGYSRNDTGHCTIKVSTVGDPGIGRSADFYSTTAIKKERLPSDSVLKMQPGCMYFTYTSLLQVRYEGRYEEAQRMEREFKLVELLQGEETEYMFIGAGYVSDPRSLSVEIMSQPLGPQTQLKHLKTFKVGVTDRTFTGRGKAVLGIFQHHTYMYYVVYDEVMSYVGRSPHHPDSIQEETTEQFAEFLPVGDTLQAQLIDWGFIEKERVVYGLLKQTDTSTNTVKYIISGIRLDEVDWAEYRTECTLCFTITSLVSVDSMHVNEWDQASAAFVFGTTEQGLKHILKVFLPAPDDTQYQAVSGVVPAACVLTDCVLMEKYVPYNTTHGALLIRTVINEVQHYAIQPLILTSIKYQDVTTVDRVAAPYGIGGIAVDPMTGMLFVAVGGVSDEPSLLLKVAVDFGDDMVAPDVQVLSRSLGYGHTGNEVEHVVALALEPVRRVLLLVCPFEKTLVTLFNTYDVLSITPNVVDAPKAGTVVTVHGMGFTDLNGVYRPMCKMGETISNGTYIDHQTILCSSVKPPSYSSCDSLSLEVSITRDEPRFTDTAIAVRRIGTPAVFDVTDKLKLPSETMIQPKPGPTSDSYSADEQGRDLQVYSSGYTDEALDITIPGAGFLDTEYIKCTINGSFYPAVYQGTTVVCKFLPPPEAQPSVTTVELTLDGQAYSENKQVFLFIGIPSGLEGFFVCNPCSDNELSVVQPDDTGVVTLETLLFRFTDSAGSFIGALGSRWLSTGNVTLESWTNSPCTGYSSITRFPFASTPSVAVENSRAVFKGIAGMKPELGCYMLRATYTLSNGGLINSDLVQLTVLPGRPKTVAFVTHPPDFSNNRNFFTRQPSLAVRDGAGNLVNLGSLEVRAELDVAALPEGLQDSITKEPLLVVEGGTATVNDQNLYAFEFLRVLGVGISGRDLSHRKIGPTSLEELYYLLNFKVQCKGSDDVCADLMLETLQHKMHIADCGTAYVGNSKLAWVEPEEQPAGSSVPITVKGWEFREPTNGEGVYKCVYHDAATERWLGTVPAAFRDSCTLICDEQQTQAALGTQARMTNVRPAFCCGGANGLGETCPKAGSAEQNCFSDGTYNWFNESSYKINYYHRYVGTSSRIGVWNVIAPLGTTAAGENMYGNSLKEQVALSFLSPDIPQSLGVRFFTSGDHISNQRERTDFDYKLLLYSESLVSDGTVLRSSEKTVASGASIWTPLEKEWEQTSLVKDLIDSSVDTRLRVAILDDAVGFLGWEGNWIASMDVISLYEQGKEVSESPRRTVLVHIAPVNTLILPGTTENVASVKGGLAQATTVANVVVKGTNVMEHSYLVFEEIAMLYPAKGEYNLVLSIQGLPSVVKRLVVKEGLPHRVVFDSQEWDIDGLTGQPVATMTINRELTTQPRFRLLDISDNTVTDLPTRHAIYVRASATPEPNCRGVPCPWQTEPLSNTSIEAEVLRKLNDPVFSSQGIAVYKDMRVVSHNVDDIITLNFEFYGSVLTQYGFVLEPLQAQLTTIKCIDSCFDLICDFEPKSLSLVSQTVLTQPLTVYGDLFDFAQAVANGNSAADRLRVRITLPMQTVTVYCELAAELANACAMRLKWPNCEYYCLNYYAPIAINVNGYTEADRESCCTTGKKKNGLSCDPTATLPALRQGTILQNGGVASLGALSSPVKSGLAVDTTGGGDAFAGRTVMRFSIKGDPVQIGAQEGHLEMGDFYAVVNADGSGYEERVLLDDFYVTSKDEAANDMAEDDPLSRRVILFVYYLPTSGPSVLLDASKITYNTGSRSDVVDYSQMQEMVNGSAHFSFTLHKPLTGSYGIIGFDYTPTSVYPESERLASCADSGINRVNECSVGSFLSKFFVDVGKPHRLAWASDAELEARVNNLEPQQITKTLIVEDIAGNKLTADDVVDSEGNTVPIVVTWTREVPELAQSLVLSRHGYTNTTQDIGTLAESACSFFTLPEATLSKEITFTFTQLRVWNEMTCKIYFEAKLPDTNTSATEDQVAARLRSSGQLVWNVSPLSCCTGNGPCTKFGFTFEFGCWNRVTRSAVPGVPDALASEAMPFACLTECGNCPSVGLECLRELPGLRATSGYWREPVSYVSWECKEDNCKGGALGDLLGLTPEHDVNRSNSQCKKGTTGTFCGECDSGYGKEQDTCAKCPDATQNYILIGLVSVALIVLIIVLVAINLNTGPTIAEVSRVSVMVKMLMNHLQVTGLTSELITKNSKTLETLTETESKGAGPGSSIISIGCASPGLDYYDLFLVWMVMPVIVVVVPALVLALIQLKKKLEGKKETINIPYMPTILECASPYHWLYDWVIIEKDREELQASIDRHAARAAEEATEPTQVGDNQTGSSGSLMRSDMEPLTISFAESTYTKLETGRKAKVRVMDKVHGTETGAVEFTKAEYGCQLCASCCLLESLFPNKGIGSVGKERYKCDIEGHRPTEKHLRNLFHGELLDACIARMKLQREVTRLYSHGISGLNFKEPEDKEWKVFLKLFPIPQGKDAKRKAKQYKGFRVDDRMAKYSVARNPPWPVEGHTPELQESIPGKEGKLIARRREKAELAVFGQGLTQQSFLSEEKDTLLCEKVSGVGNSLWKVYRTDLVTGHKMERFTHVDPLTPPQSPGAGPEADDVVIDPANHTDDREEPTKEPVPRWLLENEDLAPQEKQVMCKDVLMPVPSDEKGTHLVQSVHRLAEQIPYEQLYRMARLRRLQDKWNEWRKTLTPKEIQERLEKGGMEVEELLDDDKDDATSTSCVTVGAKKLSEEFVAMLQRQDKELVVLETCELCYHDFAVVFDPHMDQYFCEECDRLVHMHGAKRHNTRIRLQPKTSPLAEHGVEVRLNLWTVWKVAVIVILFLIYPSLTKEIALMLNCSEETCIDHSTCHRYLKADTRIDCDEAPYGAFMILAFLFFFVYGFGIPLVGWLLLRRHRKMLHTKDVLGTLGFLYSGFRKRFYYWEMVIMVRKMLVVFVVVFLDNSEHYQLYLAMWILLFFSLLNIFAKPFKFNVLWRLETTSLLSITVSLNIGLIYFEDPSDGLDLALSVILLLLNIIVLLLFLYGIFVEGKAELVQLIDEDGDGKVTFAEFVSFGKKQWADNKPDVMRSGRELDRRRADKMARTDKEKYPHRSERWQWLHDVAERTETKTRSQQQKHLTESELQQWWPIAYGEAAIPEPSPHPLVPPTPLALPIYSEDLQNSQPNNMEVSQSSSHASV